MQVSHSLYVNVYGARLEKGRNSMNSDTPEVQGATTERWVKIISAPFAGHNRHLYEGKLAQVMRTYVEPASEWSGKPECSMTVVGVEGAMQPIHLMPDQFEEASKPLLISLSVEEKSTTSAITIPDGMIEAVQRDNNYAEDPERIKRILRPALNWQEEQPPSLEEVKRVESWASCVECNSQLKMRCPKYIKIEQGKQRVLVESQPSTTGNPHRYENNWTIENHRDELIYRLGNAIKRINELESKVEKIFGISLDINYSDAEALVAITRICMGTESEATSD